MTRLIAILAILFCAAGESSAFERGDWVLGRFQNGAYWFPGVVQGRSGGAVAILYDDGDRETLPEALVRPYDWTVGARVECNWQGGGTWYRGRITALGERALNVLYDDGDRERTTTGRCRSR